MKGQVQVDVELDCQRCGEPTGSTVRGSFTFCI